MRGLARLFYLARPTCCRAWRRWRSTDRTPIARPDWPGCSTWPGPPGLARLVWLGGSAWPAWLVWLGGSAWPGLAGLARPLCPARLIRSGLGAAHPARPIWLGLAWPCQLGPTCPAWPPRIGLASPRPARPGVTCLARSGMAVPGPAGPDWAGFRLARPDFVGPVRSGPARSGSQSLPRLGGVRGGLAWVFGHVRLGLALPGWGWLNLTRLDAT